MIGGQRTEPLAPTCALIAVHMMTEVLVARNRSLQRRGSAPRQPKSAAKHERRPGCVPARPQVATWLQGSGR